MTLRAAARCAFLPPNLACNLYRESFEEPSRSRRPEIWRARRFMPRNAALPRSPNHPDFPSTVLRPGEHFDRRPSSNSWCGRSAWRAALRRRRIGFRSGTMGEAAPTKRRPPGFSGGRDHRSTKLYRNRQRDQPRRTDRHRHPRFCPLRSPSQIRSRVLAPLRSGR